MEHSFLVTQCRCVNFVVKFDMQPLPTKLVLRKKRAKEGRSGEEVEQCLVPSRVTVRRRSSVAAIERKDTGVWH